MILGKPVVTDGGKIVLSENTVLTDSVIRRLSEWGFTTLYIKQPSQEEPRIENEMSMVSEKRHFLRKHAEIVTVLKDAFEKTRYFKEVPLANMKEMAQALDSLVNSVGVISHLEAIRSIDDYVFRHSVNVGIMVGVIGKWIGMKGSPLKELVLAGLLHDIGKTQVPLEILNKGSELTEAEIEIMQEHSTLGFEMVKQTKQLSQESLLGIWQHHERMDGSGYPFGLPKSEIATYGRIIAVADMYDAMTSRNNYHQAMTPFQVIEVVSSDMFTKLDPEITIVFLENLKDSLIGYFVRLSDGTEAKVIYIDKRRTSAPVVQVAGGQYIDLAKRPELRIVEVLST